MPVPPNGGEKVAVDGHCGRNAQIPPECLSRRMAGTKVAVDGRCGWSLQDPFRMTKSLWMVAVRSFQDDKSRCGWSLWTFAVMGMHRSLLDEKVAVDTVFEMILVYDKGAELNPFSKFICIGLRQLTAFNSPGRLFDIIIKTNKLHLHRLIVADAVVFINR